MSSGVGSDGWHRRRGPAVNRIERCPPASAQLCSQKHTLAAVRLRLWSEMSFSPSAQDGEIAKFPGAGPNRLIQALAFRREWAKSSLGLQPK